MLALVSAVKSLGKTTAFRARKFKRSWFFNLSKQVYKDKISRTSLFFLLFFLVLAALSLFWTPYDFRAEDFSVARQGPSWEHLAGTDLLGRDMFTRILMAMRMTVMVMLIAGLSMSLPIAISMGIFPIFISKKLDFAVQRTGEVASSTPPLLFIIIFTTLMRQLYDDWLYNSGEIGRWVLSTGLADLALISVVFALIAWVGPSRMFRSMVLELREAPFVERAKMLGASRTRIIFRHILPQLYPYILHSVLVMFAGVIGTEIALSFFGIGIRPPYPSFGAMLSESASSQLLNSSPHLLVIPGVVVTLFLLALRILDIRSTHIASNEAEQEV